MTTSVELDLSLHCIETAARHAQRRLLEQLVGTTDGTGSEDRRNMTSAPALGRRLELLQLFLECTDFAALRTAHPVLRGGAPVWVRLERSRSGAVRWSMRDSPR